MNDLRFLIGYAKMEENVAGDKILCIEHWPDTNIKRVGYK